MILKLIYNFLLIGLFSFGGAYAAIPLTRDMIEREAFISLEEFTDMVAIAESTPGSFICNLASYIGSVNAGLIGSIITTISAIIPAFLIMMIVSYYAKEFMRNEKIKTIFSFLRPAILSLILVVGVQLLLENFDMSVFPIKKLAVLIIIILASLIYKKVFKKKLSTISIILLSAILGIIIL